MLALVFLLPPINVRVLNVTLLIYASVALIFLISNSSVLHRKGKQLIW